MSVRQLNVVVFCDTRIKPQVTVSVTRAAGRPLMKVSGEPVTIVFGHLQQEPQQFVVVSPILAAGRLSINVSGEASTI